MLPLLVFLCDALDPGNWHSKSLSSWEGWMVRRGREVAGGGGGGGSEVSGEIAGASSCDWREKGEGVVSGVERD